MLADGCLMNTEASAPRLQDEGFEGSSGQTRAGFSLPRSRTCLRQALSRYTAPLQAGSHPMDALRRNPQFAPDAPASGTPPSPATIFQSDAHRYRLIAPLGKGGMSSVYRAEVVGIGSYVAVKVLRPSDEMDAREQRLRFRREAEILTILRHPNIVRMLDFAEGPDGHLFLVMELVGGSTLLDVLLVDGPLAEDRIVSIGAQIADALDEAHRHGIVHRDLKPANVHVVRDDLGRERPVVLDFGTGKQFDQDTRHQLTGLGKYVGSMAYSSPEQLLTAPLDGRSDIYSLGICLYEMATGLVPFASSNPMDLIDLHLHEPAPRFRAMSPGCGVSECIERVVLKCLEKSPDDRWQSARDLSEALQQSWPEAPTIPG